MENEARQSSGWGKWVVALIVVAGVCVGIGYGLGARHIERAQVAAQPSGGFPSPTPLDLVGKKLSDTDVGKFAYLISTDNLTDDAKIALTGFILSHTAQADGSVVYTLKANKPSDPEYQDQTYTIKLDEQLYFIEANLRDDSKDEDTDMNLHDDHAVVVDANGIVVAQ